MKMPCPFEEYLEMDTVARKDGSARMVMPYRKELGNPAGYVHGGAIASLADSSLAVALSSIVHSAGFFTAGLQVKFRSPTRDRTLVCDSKIETKRGNFFFGKATVREEEGKVVAEAEASFSVAEKG